MKITGLIALLAILGGAAAWLGKKNGGVTPIGEVSYPYYPSPTTVMPHLEELKIGAEVVSPVAAPAAAAAALLTPIEILATSGKSAEEAYKILTGGGEADDPTFKAMMAAQQTAMFASAGVTNYAAWAAAVSAEMSQAAGRPM